MSSVFFKCWKIEFFREFYQIAQILSFTCFKMSDPC